METPGGRWMESPQSDGYSESKPRLLVLNTNLV